MAPLTGLLPAAADSARAIQRVYTVSLSAFIPLIVAWLAALALRDSQAAARAAVWRATVVALLVVYVGGLLPVHRIAWVVPAGLASPLIVLGRMQLGTPVVRLLAPEALSGSGESLVVRLLFVVYSLGVSAVLMSLGVAAVRLARRTRRAAPARDPRLVRILEEARCAMGVRQAVRLLISTETSIPMTWGVFTSTILAPADIIDTSDDHLRALLAHELSHIRSRDATFAVASRIACALLWFHPAAWWLDRRLHTDCEIACDDRVLATGVRQSDYAEFLADACDRLQGDRSPQLALAICGHAGLRQRLAAILDPARDRRRASTCVGTMAMTVTMLVAVPASLTQLAPARSVLTSLMRDPRWEARAYAVFGLAQRPDSIQVAWVAASSDPDPKVRAWAQYALSLELVDVRATRARSAH